MKADPRSKNKPPAILTPLSRLDRSWLFMLRDVAGGKMELRRVYDQVRAQACMKAGYCQIDQVRGSLDRVRLNGSGQRYLDAVLRAD